MHEDEVLAAGLSDKTGIADVLVEVLADLLPEGVEGSGGAGEVDSCQVLRCEDLLADDRTLSGDEVDYAVGEAGFLVDLHQIVVGKDSCGRRLPYGDVTHQHGRHIEVGSDGGEVERGEGEYESLEGAVLDGIDLSLGALGLEGIDLRSKVRVVAQEVDKLAYSVDLGLVDILALAEHSGGAHNSAVFGGDELGDLQQDGGADGPIGLAPLLARLHRGVDGHLDLLGACLVVGGQDVVMVVGHHDLAGIARTDLLAADDKRDVKLYGFLSFEFFLQCDALRRAFKIGQDRFVGRHRK